MALGMSACAPGLRTMFTTAAGLITTLGTGLYENRLEERLKVPDPAQAPDHRRDRPHPDRPAGRQLVLPTDQPTL